MAERELYIGIMSGTSMDGVDTALVAFTDHHIELLAHRFLPMPEKLKQRLLNICLGQATHLQEIGQLDHQLGHLYADAVEQLLAQSGYHAAQITAIGNHGQTVFHQPDGESPFTLQLGDANILAARTGITTIADFRRKDMALGGQGAPLVPAFHRTIFNVTDSTVVVLNIGGIANISVLFPDKTVLGYDTGPGNALMDSWCQRHTQQSYDANGEWGRQGNLNASLLQALKQDPYFLRPAPKSTGREYFNLPWLEAHLVNHPLSAPDVQRTLCELTAQTITDEVCRYAQGPTPKLFVCGGGAQNDLLMDCLQAHLPTWQVASTDSKGVNGDYMEAMAFAWLAQRRVHGLPSNLPEVTGAKQLASLGVIYPADERVNR
ncbi:anhydro-N-acetylmuramic acid kinase [Vibrio cincinnatiensis]|jgi:anhydro-N-acetylmuramic acid kinase|uniref:Anhydro-N-acetylmuramic acid kinase n=1 Tax=Vibrio cincinnatiensis DSM 19608 TaxID=1123491 RepID=A0A1T4PH12_VIBCI|nr:anhydro-N-acetylmuramic acid kinase [Vibrio cincinnatiensis]MCG3721643.1 anhydro-N-acetylmuramic acid kinase [Vibrio cincinnatiensis]SJZ90844.1 anhydro-N-acetylmuramic acid kinase [Vibrio cincinnatiensis DSM 19608]SUP47805.1 anhydro-N-acetylmuramic acid kinase [Vibrio cincinnatiensis]